ncbi:Variant SH3 domain protein [Caenorhabditis elegans]|uniref:Variant SH3 domain protein n=1 Tax=Caenorhabditis elegans TaxID=6239 RepID=Q9N415_CAEEL|nr:Variant SH3 domain protein [Caenorhabditis elegans]CCD73780.2 Variant SH3 domain protein [Caenorhabditis elegans]|eukprot:NP_497459.3 RIM Binding protein [Caenorhabditis elegans]
MLGGLSGPGPPPPPPPASSYGMVPGPSTSFTNHLGPTTSSASTVPPTSDALLLQLRSRPNSRVFRALFQYLPLRDSPNENPQLELSLQPGDVVLVKGEMDSDGFYCGETLDGRQGLVPSNYVERVPDSVLLANARAPSPSFPLRIPQHFSTITHDFSSPDHSTLPDSVCPYPPADVTKVTVQEIKNNETPRIPCPRELIVEKKLSRSALVSWSSPEESFVAVSQYHVCVDGTVRAIVPGSYKCRALVEDIPLESSVNLSVRAVTEHGHSPDACCTIAIGNEAQVAPQQVRVWQVTPVSAYVRWYPSNSNAEHVVSLNAVKVGVCPPTVFQVQLHGLQPSTIYRVSVRTKHPKAVLEQRPVERCVDFKTLPKIGLPDPPSNVQVEGGAQPGTLLVSWIPVTNQPKPPSRAAVASYLVYADGKNIAQVPQATADHVVLRLADLSDDPPVFITVRTKTKEGAVSSDSNVTRVPRNQNAAPPPPPPPPTQIGNQSIIPVVDPSRLPLVDMTSSYPSYQQQQTLTNSMYMPIVTSTGAAVPLTNGHHHVATSAPSSAPFTAPARMIGATGLMSYQPTSYAANLQNSMQQSAPNSGHSGYATFDRSASLGAQPQATSILLGGGAAPRPSSVGQNQSAWKAQQPAQMSQYYTFHPSFLHTEPSGANEPRPSVLEMENSYLMRHRQAADHWASAPDARARIEAYSRGLARAGSADDRMVPMSTRQQPQLQRLIAAGSRAPLARVKSETGGFGTRSEPDLRPPTLDSDECRWFVALFDYTAAMSPNPNAEFEELQFRKHQLIKVYGGQDIDGFYHGAIGQRVGLVPSNMVIEIASDDIGKRRTTTNPAPPPPTAPEPALRRQRWGSLKSRSYDYAGEGRAPRERPHHPNYVSLDRRDDRDRDREGRYRRAGSSYEYRRLPEREKEYEGTYRRRQLETRDPRDPRDPRDDGYEDEGYRDKYRDRYDRRHPMDREREPRYPPYEPPYRGEKYEKYRERPRMEDMEFPSNGPHGSAQQQPHSLQNGPRNTYGMDQMTQQMSHMSTQGSMAQGSMGQGSMSQGPIGIPSSSGIGGMGGAGNQEMYMNGGMGTMGTSMTSQAAAASGAQKMARMVAKFDYDSRQLSPNVDAEQVELSFRQGDIIIVLGDMDEDGFYMGELNGLRGLVPSNFLQPQPLNNLLPSQPTEPMRKGVAFSDTQQMMRKPIRQSSQTSAGPSQGSSGGLAGAVASAAAASGGIKPVAKKSSAGSAGAGAKPLTKKTSDVGKSSAPNARKTSTAVKKADTGAKKKG